MANVKNYRKQGGDEWVVEGEVNIDGGEITNSGTQASAIANVDASVSGADDNDHNEVAGAVNSILAALRGVGIIDT